MDFSKVQDNSLNFNKVTDIKPKTFEDARGGFCQKMSINVFGTLDWIQQVNHSYSKPGVFRGFHAQFADSCQGKLVENLSKKYPIYDIIIDARPDSSTYKSITPYVLYPFDSSEHNLLWVPRGFLHGFLTPLVDDPDMVFLFQYYCDNVYNKRSEVGVCPYNLLTESNLFQNVDGNSSKWDLLKNTLKSGQLTISDKDNAAKDLNEILSQFEMMWSYGAKWYSEVSNELI